MCLKQISEFSVMVDKGQVFFCFVLFFLRTDKILKVTLIQVSHLTTEDQVWDISCLSKIIWLINSTSRSNTTSTGQDWICTWLRHVLRREGFVWVKRKEVGVYWGGSYSSLTLIARPRLIGSEIEGMMGTIPKCLLKYIRLNYTRVWRKQNVAYLFSVTIFRC